MAENKPIVLDYARGGDAPLLSGKWAWAMFVLSLPLGVIPFLPFVDGVSPAAVMFECAHSGLHSDSLPVELGLLAWPFCVGIAIAGWRVRMLPIWRKKPGVVEYTSLSVAVGSSMLASLFISALIIWYVRNGSAEPASLSTALIPGIGVILMLLLLRTRFVAALGPQRRGTLARSGAYLANAICCLVLFGPFLDEPFIDRESGYYVVAVMVVPMMAEVTWLLWQSWRWRTREHVA